VISEDELPLLEELAAEPSLSQRQLARRLGLSLGKVHFMVRRLVERGWVEVLSVASSKHKLGYVYALTPGGLEQKARLTYRFLHRMAEQYQQMVERVDGLLGAAIAEERTAGEPVPVALVGTGRLGEVVSDVIAVRRDARLVPRLEQARVVVVVDPDAPRPAGARIVELA
jgi:MarR family transcriptional regulator, temperature-dependent positive regulator of motility